jgi:hypothetical protein
MISPPTMRTDRQWVSISRNSVLAGVPLCSLELASNRCQQPFECRCFLQPQPKVQPDDAERQSEQERNPPTPGEHLRTVEQRREAGDEDRAEGVAGQRPELEPAPEETAAPVWCVLRDEGHGAAVLSTGREALHQPTEQHE